MKQKKMQSRRQTVKKALLISTVAIVVIIGCYILYRYVTSMWLTQIAPTSNRQNMGYSIQTHSGKLILIDGGTSDDTQRIKQEIASNGNVVHAWYLTHPHIDHVGAFNQIIKEIEAGNSQIKIEKIYVTLNSQEWYHQYHERDYEEKDVDLFFEAISSPVIQGRIEPVELHQQMQFDNVEVKVLGVSNKEITNNSFNNSSMILQFKINDKKILFLGDAGAESGQQLLVNNTKEELKSDMVQIAHHGQEGVEFAVYQAISPSIALWPTPDWLWNNDMGEGEDSGSFKTKQVRSWMKQLNVKKNYVAKDGDITLKIW